MAPSTSRDASPSRGCPLEPRRSRAMHPATLGPALGGAAGRRTFRFRRALSYLDDTFVGWKVAVNPSEDHPPYRRIRPDDVRESSLIGNTRRTILGVVSSPYCLGTTTSKRVSQHGAVQRYGAILVVMLRAFQGCFLTMAADGDTAR